MAFLTYLFPCELTSDNVLILHDIKNQVDILVPQILSLNTLCHQNYPIDFSRISSQLDTILSGTRLNGKTHVSLLLHFCILDLCYLTSLMHAEYTGISVLLSIKLKNQIERLKALYLSEYERFLMN